MNTITAIWNFLDGKKTYISAAATVLYGVVVLGFGNHNWQAAAELVLTSSSVTFVRSAIASNHAKQIDQLKAVLAGINQVTATTQAAVSALNSSTSANSGT